MNLVKTINRRLTDAGGDPLPETLLEENFKLFWPQLEKKLAEVAKAVRSKPLDKAKEITRDERAILDEILELARSQERRLFALEARTGPRTLTPKVRRHPEILALELYDRKNAKKLAVSLKRLLDPDATISIHDFGENNFQLEGVVSSSVVRRRS